MLGLLFTLGGLAGMAWVPYIVYLALKRPKTFLAENQQDLPVGCAYAVIAALIICAGPGGLIVMIIGLRELFGG